MERANTKVFVRYSHIYYENTSRIIFDTEVTTQYEGNAKCYST